MISLYDTPLAILFFSFFFFGLLFVGSVDAGGLGVPR